MIFPDQKPPNPNHLALSKSCSANTADISLGNGIRIGSTCPELPADILQQIFPVVVLLAKEQYDYSLWPYPSQLSQDLRSLCAVCYHWRSVAINDAYLWAQIVSFGGQRQTQWDTIVLSRARSRQRLCANIFVTNHVDDPAAKAAALYAGRFEEIVFTHLSHDHASASNLLCTVFDAENRNDGGSEAPHLTSLTINFPPRSYTSLTSMWNNFAGSVEPSGDPIREKTVKRRFPHLTHLRLRNCMFNPGSLSRQLTHLDIEIQRQYDTASYWLTRLQLPFLTFLRLHDPKSVRNYTPDADKMPDRWDTVQSCPLLDLPHLETLFYSNTFNDVYNFLKHLTRPASCNIGIIISNKVSTGDWRRLIDGVLGSWAADTAIYTNSIGWHIGTLFNGMTTISSLHQERSLHTKTLSMSQPCRSAQARLLTGSLSIALHHTQALECLLNMPDTHIKAVRIDPVPWLTNNFSFRLVLISLTFASATTLLEPTTEILELLMASNPTSNGRTPLEALQSIQLSERSVSGDHHFLPALVRLISKRTASWNRGRNSARGEGSSGVEDTAPIYVDISRIFDKDRVKRRLATLLTEGRVVLGEDVSFAENPRYISAFENMETVFPKDPDNR